MENNMSLLKKLIIKYDWFIYHRSYNTFKRMAKRDSGFAYFLFLHMQEHLRLNPPSEEVKHSAEQFHNALKDMLGYFLKEYKVPCGADLANFFKKHGCQYYGGDK